MKSFTARAYLMVTIAAVTATSGQDTGQSQVAPKTKLEAFNAQSGA